MTMTIALRIASLEWISARARRRAAPASSRIDWDAYARREPMSRALTFGSNQPRPLAEDYIFFNPVRVSCLTGSI
jgi:hypothetical protein